MDRATHLHNKQLSNSEKFHRILFYLCRYTVKLLLTEISIHAGIFVLTFKAHGPYCVRSIRLECQNKYFLVWTSSSVNKSKGIIHEFMISLSRALESSSKTSLLIKLPARSVIINTNFPASERYGCRFPCQEPVATYAFPSDEFLLCNKITRHKI